MLRSPVQFEEYSLDCERYELLRAGRPVKLEKIPMELLILLVDKDGRLVTRREIVDQLWGKDVFIDTEHGINTAVRKVRLALRDDPEKPRFVQTVTGKGYRFVGQLTNRTRPAAAVLDPAPLADASTPHKAVLGKPALIATSLVLSAAIALSFNVFDVRDRFFGSNRPVPIHSIAVLPLANLSGDPSQEYFADGVTDELITMLAKNTSFRVISRTSSMRYKGTSRPVAEIARELNVDGILEGSISRSADHVHITAQLIYAPTDHHIWAESYDRNTNEAMSIPSDLSQTIARRLSKAAASITASKYISAGAHDAYLRGRYVSFASDDNEGSRKYFEKAIQLQPDYAAAWSGLADSYAIEAVEWRAPPPQLMEKAERAARHALELDDSMAEAHSSLAAFYLFGKWDLKSADVESARAIELNPNLGGAHHLRAYTLMAMQRPDDALLEEKRSSELDPLAEPWGIGYVLIRLHRVDEAIGELRMRTAVQPKDSFTRLNLSDAYWLKGMWADSIREAEASFLDDGDKKSAQELRRAFDSGGRQAAAEWWVKHAQSQNVKGYVSPLSLANSYALVEKKDETLRCLELAYGEHSSKLVFLQNNPAFDFLHSEERYRALVKKMGLPPAW